MTVEASLVMPVALLVLAGMLGTGIRAHNTVFENLLTNEAVELFGHMQTPDAAALELYAGERLSQALPGTEDSVTISKFSDGSRAVLHSSGGERQLQDGGCRPEKIMRAVTLTEEILK